MKCLKRCAPKAELGLRVLAAAIVISGAHGQDAFFLKSGDRILPLGQHSAGTGFDLAFLQLAVWTRLPQKNISFIHEASDTTDAAPVVEHAHRERATVLLLIDRADKPGTVTSERLASLLPSTRVSVAKAVAGKGVQAAVDLLRTWGVPPIVSMVEIDVPTGRSIATNTTVHDLQSDQVIAWTQDDEALPFPREPLAQLEAGGFDISTIDLQGLRVTRLPKQVYILTIDGQVIGQFTREQLESGLNLAFASTPMTRQADRAYALLSEAFNGSGKSTDRPEVPDHLQALSPRPHDYELHPVETP